MLKHIRSKSISIVSIFAVATIFISNCYPKYDTKQDVSLDILINSLNSGHYQPLELNDSLSSKIFNLYIKRLDYNKKFFTQTDINLLRKYQYQLDDEISKRKIVFSDTICSILTKRVAQAEGYYKELLSTPFQFDVEESIELDPEKLSFAANENELKNEWRKALKYQVLSRVVELQENQEKAKEKSDTVKLKNLIELEKEAREKVLKNNNDFFKRLQRIDKKDHYNTYLSTISNVYDPHTEFFPAKDKKNFDIGMTGQLEGIGAQLQEKDGNIKVSSIVPGSASWRQGQLKAGDVIQKVAQGNQEPVDVVGMRLDNAVELIRGKKGTEVRLTVQKVDGSIVVIPIVRDIVVLEETYAQSAIIKNKKNIGYIKLPVFYSDFNQSGSRRSSVDVKKEIQKLKKENVGGIILDLRDNGGGSLQDAVDMAGLFINSGPIVQVKSKMGSPSILRDSDPGIEYDGPLVILVNSNSASASEILAAAMQDYKRAVVVGTPTTFGKGTVQRFLNLDDYLIASFDTLKPLGSLKITFQKFYRITGASTQLKGVTPDIVFPDQYKYIETGEKDQDFPLSWDEIATVEYNKWTKLNIDEIEKLRKSSEARMSKNESFLMVDKRAEKLKKDKDETTEILEIQAFINNRKKEKEENKIAEDVFSKEIGSMSISNLSSEKQIIESDTTKSAKNKEWIKNLKKDFYLYEATNIINEIKP